MNEALLSRYAKVIDNLMLSHNHRSLRKLSHHGSHIAINGGQQLVNLASNDYLGIASNADYQENFLDNLHDYLPLGSSSSRLLTGNFAVYERLEAQMSQLFGRACLLFNSGYHANVGILPAICDGHTLILADKLVHASMIDGIRLAMANGSQCVRYQHQNFAQLERLIQKYHDKPEIHQIIILTESIFSMDGDVTDLPALVRLKAGYPKLVLYVDEAHAIGVRGHQGLGCTEEFGCIDEIDFIVGAFGKAVASVGGYVICHEIIKDYLINTMRPLIFSTALPPLNVAWTAFVLDKLVMMTDERARLQARCDQLIDQVQRMGFDCPSASQIVPIILKDNAKTLQSAQWLGEQGYFVLGVRPPTVPQNQSRLRVCLNTAISDDEFEGFCAVMAKLTQQCEA